MEKQQIGSAALREPSFPWWLRALIGALGIAVFGVAVLRRAVSDPDTFWHIRAGQWLPTTWQFAGPEPWSLASSRPWVLHEWLPELLMGWVESRAGLTGISWLWATGVVLVGVTVWYVCRQRAFSMLAGLVTAVTLLAMSGSLTPRPHLVTFALASIFTHAWLRSVHDLRARWWLVLVSWLWACSHGMWFIGPLIGAAIVAGALLDRRLPSTTLPKLLAVLVGTIVAGALTPLGPRLLLAPLHVGEYTDFVSEWQPMELMTPQMIAFMSVAGTIVVIWARSARTVPWTDVLVVAMAVGFALLYARTVAVGAAIIAPVAAASLASVVPIKRERLRWAEWGVLITACSAALAATALLAPGALGTDGAGPTDIQEDLASLDHGSVVCNDYDVGGWLLWRVPGLHPTIDGRAEVYSVEHVRASGEFPQGAPGWREHVDNSGCSSALVAVDAPVVEDLTEAGWATVAEGEEYVLLVRE